MFIFRDGMCNSYVFDGWRYGCKEDWKNETFLVLKWRDGVRTSKCINIMLKNHYIVGNLTCFKYCVIIVF